MEYREIKDLCKYSGQSKCPKTFCACDAEYCPLVPDTCDCEDSCDKVDELRYKIRSANCALRKEMNKRSVLETENFPLKLYADDTPITSVYLANSHFKKDFYAYRRDNITVLQCDHDSTKWQIDVAQQNHIDTFTATTIGQFRQFLNLCNINYI